MPKLKQTAEYFCMKKTVVLAKQSCAFFPPLPSYVECCVVLLPVIYTLLFDFFSHLYIEITYFPEISVYGITLASVSLFSLRIIISAQGRNPDSLLSRVI